MYLTGLEMVEATTQADIYSFGICALEVNLFDKFLIFRYIISE